MKKIAAVVILLVVLVAVPVFAEHITMVVEGQRQGVFRADTRGVQIPVLGTSHSVVSPRDPASGLPTGQRMHKPFVVTKAIGPASTQLYTALFTNENLKTVVLTFISRGPKGELIPTYSVKLYNANVASIDLRSSELIKMGNNAPMPDYEEIAFTYQKIEIENKLMKTMAMDSWTAINP